MEVKRVLRTYSDKFSKKTYTQHQHAVAILLMKYENKPYRDIAELLKEFCMYFGFGESTPHFTTLQKFFDRIPGYKWDFLIAKTYELFMSTIANIAIDSTGYKLHHASQHYEHRIKRNYRRKRFMKHFLSVDTDKQAIIASENWRSYVNDTVRFKPIAKKTRKLVRIENITADKGSDSESNHKFAHKIGANSIIPLKYVVPLSRTKGFYRRKLRRHFPQKLYNQRPKIETINSVEKRKFGDELRSKLLRMQRKEMKVIDVVYNIHRYISYYVSVVIGFLQNPIFLS
ncbi:MAG: IS5 family transposase [Candidatus Micrarchaeales archaeon]